MGLFIRAPEVYGGLSGTWDYGPLGVSLKRKNHEPLVEDVRRGAR